MCIRDSLCAAPETDISELEEIYQDSCKVLENKDFSPNGKIQIRRTRKTLLYATRSAIQRVRDENEREINIKYQVLSIKY